MNIEEKVKNLAWINDHTLGKKKPFQWSMDDSNLFIKRTIKTKDYYKEITNEQLEHFGNPVARWMMANVVLKVDPVGQIMPDKSKSQYKIDGVAAMVNAKAVDLRMEANGYIETESTAL